MRIAIASEGEGLDSEISLMGGRAPYYLVFENNKLIEVIKNPFSSGGGGAGFSVAYMLAEKKVDLIIAGNFGGNMQTALKEKEIEIKEVADKKVSDIITK